jgi:glycosyltransferase involved in cell wall biosynthesis
VRGLVILPTYNEAGTIEEVIRRTLAATPDVDLLVVDDASPDGTGKIADRIAVGEPRLQVMHRPAKGGLGPAYLEGFRDGLDRGYDLLLEMDSDLSHDPGDVARLLEASGSADLVIGSRYVPGGSTVNWSPFRRVLSRAGTMYAKTMLGLPLADATSGFRSYRRAVLESIPLAEIRSEGYAFQIEMAWRSWTLGFRAREIPIVFTERREGASKMSRRIVGEALWRVFVWAFRRSRPPARPHPRSIAGTF